MDELILALAPAFVAGLATQRVLELAAGLLDIAGEASVEEASRKNRANRGLLGWLAKDTHLKWAKAGCAAILSIVVGIVFAMNNVTVLAPLKWTGPGYVDVFATILVVSAGTEGMNSILKWLGYSKEDAKASKPAKEAEAVLAKAEADLAKSGAPMGMRTAFANH